MPTPSLRCDAPLIRHLSKTYDPLIARMWQDKPLIQFPAYLNRRILDEFSCDIRYRPFDDFVMDLWDVLKDLNSSNDLPLTGLWSHIIPAKRFIEEMGKQRSWVTDAGGIPEILPTSMICENWVRTAEEFQVELIEISGEPPYRYRALMCEDDYRKPRKEIERIAISRRERGRLASAGITYLGTCAEYLVEERPAGPAPRRKAKDIKPWTYTHLPRIILLDPTATPQAPNSDREGSHASPRPHQRRGHWRRLLSPRYQHRGQRIFVKQSWVGPREWILNGNVYRVLDDANRPQPKGPTSIERLTMAALNALDISYEPQKIIGRCIVDIFIAPNIVLELDGKYWHNLPGAKERDAKRDAWLQSRGYVVHRITEDAINVDARTAICAALNLPL